MQETHLEQLLDHVLNRQDAYYCLVRRDGRRRGRRGRALKRARAGAAVGRRRRRRRRRLGTAFALAAPRYSACPRGFRLILVGEARPGGRGGAGGGRARRARGRARHDGHVPPVAPEELHRSVQRRVGADEVDAAQRALAHAPPRGRVDEQQLLDQDQADDVGLVAALVDGQPRVARLDQPLQQGAVEDRVGGERKDAAQRRHRRGRDLAGQVQRPVDDLHLVAGEALLAGAARLAGRARPAPVALGVQLDERLELRAAEEDRLVAQEPVEAAAQRPGDGRGEDHRDPDGPGAVGADRHAVALADLRRAGRVGGCGRWVAGEWAVVWFVGESRAI
jgi:hypothetical protein